MCEGLSTIVNGPIPTYPLFLKENNIHDNTPRITGNRNCEGPTKLSGPIISHFGFENEEEKAQKNVVDYVANARVREAGQKNLNANKHGNGAALLIELQGRPCPPPTYRHRELPKNYIAANTTKIKSLMRKVKEREAQKETENNAKNIPMKALWKSEKYNNVQSKLKEMLQQSPLAPRDVNHENKTTNYLRAHSRTGGSRPQTARQSPKPDTDAQQTVAKKFASKDDIDFVKHNQKIAAKTQIKRAPSVEQLKSVQNKLENDMKKYNSRIKGKTPQYLEQRQEEVKKEYLNYLKNIPDPDQPAGHRKLPDHERKSTLCLLEETQKKLVSELNALPIRNDTLKLRTLKGEMEKKLVEIEEAIKIFSKSKVFVKLEE